MGSKSGQINFWHSSSFVPAKGRQPCDNALERVFIIKTWYNEFIMREKYETDLTDEQWEEMKPLFVNMRNRKWEKRELVNAVLYLVKTGCQ